MKKKQFIAAGVSVAMILSLTACGSTAVDGNTVASVSSEAETMQSEKQSEANTTLEGTEEVAKAAEVPVQDKPLVVYLNDFDGVIVDMFKEATGYDVEVVVGNGAETMSRIAAEKSNPQWDVVWIDSMYDVYICHRMENC